MSDKAKWGYLAGMIDGEGHISISKGSTPAKNGNGYMTSAPRYNLIVAVTGTRQNLMEWLVANFGGSWSDSKRQKPNWRAKLTWNVCGLKNKEHILLGVMPYLVIKKNQAILGLEFIRMAGENNPAKRQEIQDRLKALNQKGNIVEANTPDLSKPKGPRHCPKDLEPVLERMIESSLIEDDENALMVT